MIQLPTKTQIQTLKSWREPNCVTIYAPYIGPNTSDSNPNRTEFKNLLKKAVLILKNKPLKQHEIDYILDPAYQLVDSDEFTTNAKRSLVIFLHHDFFAYFHLPPEGFDQRVIVGKGFVLRPIQKIIDENLKFFVLHLSYNGARLYRGDLYRLRQLKFQKAPLAMVKELNIDEFPKEDQLHIIGPLSNGRGSKRFHGQYEKILVNKELLISFFRRINKKVCRRLKNSNLPLILAGVDYLLPIYQKVNTYHHLVTEDMTGNYEHSSLERIRAKACEILIKLETDTKLHSIK